MGINGGYWARARKAIPGLRPHYGIDPWTLSKNDWIR